MGALFDRTRPRPRVPALERSIVIRNILAGTAALAVISSSLLVAPAAQAADGDHVVINEFSVDSSYDHKWIELYNPTGSPVDLTGWSIQYRSASNVNPVTSSGVYALSGTIPADDYFVVTGATAAGATPVPTDLALSTGLNFSGSNGQIFLADTATGLPVGGGSIVSDSDDVVDLVGYGTAAAYETAAAPALGGAVLARSADGTDSDDNSADLSAMDPTPGALNEDAPEEPPAGTKTIAELQGTGPVSPFDQQVATTRGVVTAAYPTGGFAGYYLQTEGTGGALDETHTASDGIFVYSPSTVSSVEVGDFVEVTGTVSEYFGLTELSVPSGGVTQLAETPDAVQPADVDFPDTNAEVKDKLKRH